VETVPDTLPEGKPIWEATSESVNPNSSNELVAEITRLVERELQNEKRVGTP
jgi:hypothetical protein